MIGWEERSPQKSGESGGRRDEATEALIELLAGELKEEEEYGGALVMNEIQAYLKIGEQRLRRIMKGLKRKGMIEVVQVKREALDGVYRAVPGYRVIANRMDADE